VKLGIIGTGNLGRGPGKSLAAAAHEILFAGGASAADAAGVLGAKAG
jgi:predicted dinucleotide-binding enzyme